MVEFASVVRGTEVDGTAYTEGLAGPRTRSRVVHNRPGYDVICDTESLHEIPHHLIYKRLSSQYMNSIYKCESQYINAKVQS